VLAVGPGGADVVGGVGAFGGARGRVCGACAAGQRGLDRGGAHRGSAHVDQGDPAVLDGAADYGPVDRPLGELLERPGGGGRLRYPDLGEQLAGLQRGLEEVPEELPDRYLTGAIGAARDHRRVQRQQNRGQVRGGVGVRDRAADRAAVPDLRVADLAGRVGEQRHRRCEQLGVLDVVMPGQRAYGDVGSLVGDVGQVAQAAEVDDHLGGGQAQLHQRE
jgi:hypothetical protein